MSSPPPDPRSDFSTPNFPFKVNPQGTSDESRMPGYKFFKDATNNFSMDQKLGSGRWGDVYKVSCYELRACIASLVAVVPCCQML
uniref:Uncharacterized protein n=1 Tax=Aegilops tauschii subsp. strangulata TaxID=200361 RepID=A0A453MFQ8_AEGTS